MSNIKVTEVKFDKPPFIIPRITHQGMSKKELKDINKFPYELAKSFSFHINFKFNDIEYGIGGVIEKGFKYNCADVPFLLQVITYDKHSPYLKHASLIHDWWLKNKERLYITWAMAEKGISRREFRILSSKSFEHIMKLDAVPDKKAAIITYSVDWFQKLFCWSWFKVGKQGND